MRLPRVVARAALIAALASVVVPGLAGSQNPSDPGVIDPTAFSRVDVRALGTTVTAPALDPENQSDGRLASGSVFEELIPVDPNPIARPTVTVAAGPVVRRIAPPPPRQSTTSTSGGSSGGSSSGTSGGSTGGDWSYASSVSWYGPGFYGNTTACGQTLTTSLYGVAHRTLPCGTRVTFKYNGRVVTARVVDRGPYVSGRLFDLTGATCAALAHCFTGPIYYRIG